MTLLKSERETKGPDSHGTTLTISSTRPDDRGARSQTPLARATGTSREIDCEAIGGQGG